LLIIAQPKFVSKNSGPIGPTSITFMPVRKRDNILQVDNVNTSYSGNFSGPIESTSITFMPVRKRDNG
jgi:hypothetical protein